MILDIKIRTCALVDKLKIFQDVIDTALNFKQEKIVKSQTAVVVPVTYGTSFSNYLSDAKNQEIQIKSMLIFFRDV